MPSAFCLLPPKFTQRKSYVLQSSRCVYFLFHRGRCQAAKQPHKLQQVHIFQRGFDRRGRTSSSLGFFRSVSHQGAGSHTVEVLEYSQVTPQLISKDTRLKVTLKMNVDHKITSNMQKVVTLLQTSFKNVFIIISL